MIPSHDLQDVIRLLRRPLEYASGLEPRRLQVMPSLGRDLLKILDQYPAVAPAFVSFRDQIMEMDRQQGQERMARIISLLRYLDRLEKAPSAPMNIPPTIAESHELWRALKELATEVQYVKGVGPRSAEKLNRLGLHTLEDLLYHLPARYEDRRSVKKIRELSPGERATVVGEVLTCGPAQKHRLRQYYLLIGDNTGILTAKWFNYSGDYLEKKFHVGQKVIASEVVRCYGRNLEMHHPEVEILEGEDISSFTGVVPVYPSTEGLFQKTLHRIVESALLTCADKLPETLPPPLLEKHGFPPLAEALKTVHQPPVDVDLLVYNEHRSPSHRRLAYEEFFFLELGLALRRRGFIEEPAAAIPVPGGLVERFRAGLPFTLTGSQEKVIGELFADLAKPSPMHRLLQGDVGSGKTVVALFAALAVIAAGHQAAIMAPTEILAEQHFRTVTEMLAGLPVSVALLTSGLRGRERRRVLSEIAEGRVQMVVGTHAVIQERVQFKSLALGIIDEQHRFGVLQRARLKAKGPEGSTPHLLVMTATPIPRTLALTLYGDLSVSVIREMPPGRRPVQTRVMTERERKKMYELVREEAAVGRQVFIVYPLVEESDKLELKAAVSMAQNLRERVFPDLKVGLVHGKMKAEEKDEVMRAFQAGEIQVLAATTVIEVGIDVRNAALMVVEHAERFGLSQLHQLRGRVGRGEVPSRCVLMTGFTRSEEAWRRLRVMEKTNDGFRIAEEDLALRGPGEFFGTRQWGLPGFRVADLIRDAEILSGAREDAFELVKQDPELSRPENAMLRLLLKKRWGKRLRLGSVG